MKKLYRSRNNKTFCGLFGGLGECLGVDPVMLRAFFVIVIIITGVVPGVIAYFIACLIVPKQPK